METETSLSCLQELATRPYSEPAVSSQHPHTQFNMYYSSVLQCTPRSLKWPLHPGFPIRFLYFPLRATCPSRVTLFLLHHANNAS
jgi:hypothetical protein